MKKFCRFSSILIFLFFAANLSIVFAEHKPQRVEDKFPGLAMGALKFAKLTHMKPEMLLTAEGIEIYQSDIDKMLEQMPPEIRDQWKPYQFFLLEQEAVEKILLRQASKDGLSSDGRSDKEIIQTYLNQKAENITVSDEEAKSFYDSNKEMIGNLLFDQVKDSIKIFVTNQKKQATVENYLVSLGNTSEIWINHDWVATQDKLVKDNPVDKARSSGIPTMAEFGANGCVPCDLMQPILDKLRTKYKDKLNVVFAHVRENPVLGARFGIRAIPVQVFYDKDGKEVFRHTGFFPEPELMKQLEKLGIK